MPRSNPDPRWKQRPTVPNARNAAADDLVTMPYLRPRGFTVDAALPEGGREAYRSVDGSEAGFTPPAQLLVGANAITRGQSNASFAPKLYSATHMSVTSSCATWDLIGQDPVSPYAQRLRKATWMHR